MTGWRSRRKLRAELVAERRRRQVLTEALDVVLSSPLPVSTLALRGLFSDLPLTADGSLDSQAVAVQLFDHIALSRAHTDEETARHD